MTTNSGTKSTKIELYGIRVTATLAILTTLLSATPLAGQFISESSGDRKILSRIDPVYPETLKRLFIGGAVRVQIVVVANGNVESTELLGGNPILGQAAMKAIKQWKYAPGKPEEKLIVKVAFDPHE